MNKWYHTEETKKKISENTKLAMKDPIIREKISKAHLGRFSSNKDLHLSEETKRKISEALTGRKLLEEVKKKMSISRKGKNYLSTDAKKNISNKNKEWWKNISIQQKEYIINKSRIKLIGKKQSYETIEKRSKKLRGLRRTEEVKSRISKKLMGRISPMKGRHHSEKTIDKMSNNNKGKLLSLETRKKISLKLKDGFSTGKFIVAMKGKHHKEESRLKIKIKRSNQIVPMQDTKIEIKIQEYLKQLKVYFFTHVYMKEINHSYQCDILIPVQKSNTFFIKKPIIIECDGDAYHFNPIKYNKDSKIFKYGKTAKEQWELDFIRTEELVKRKYTVIRLWESEINKLNLNDLKIKIGL